VLGSEEKLGRREGKGVGQPEIEGESVRLVVGFLLGDVVAAAVIG